jgi:hypothetical protein
MISKKYDADDEYRTTDIYLTAFLIAGKFTSLNRVESTGDKRRTFVLNPSPTAEQIQSFYSRSSDSKIVARDLLEELRNLKGMIMNGSADCRGTYHDR